MSSWVVHTDTAQWRPFTAAATARPDFAPMQAPVQERGTARIECVPVNRA